MIPLRRWLTKTGKTTGRLTGAPFGFRRVKLLILNRIEPRRLIDIGQSELSGRSCKYCNYHCVLQLLYLLQLLTARTVHWSSFPVWQLFNYSHANWIDK